LYVFILFGRRWTWVLDGIRVVDLAIGIRGRSGDAGPAILFSCLGGVGLIFVALELDGALVIRVGFRGIDRRSLGKGEWGKSG
jgi:hypothetical protein